MIQKLVFFSDGYRVTYDADLEPPWSTGPTDPKEKLDKAKAVRVTDALVKQLIGAYLLDPLAIPMTKEKP